MRSISSMSSRDRRQLGRRDIGRDLLRRGRAGDDARHHRAVQQPAEGEVEQAVPARRAERGETLDRVPVRLGQIALGDVRHRGQPSARRRRRVAAVFPGQQAVGERRERDQAEPIGLQHRHQRVVELALQHVVALLAGDEGREIEMLRGPLRLDDLPGRQPSSSRCSAPCPAARDRRARAASPRSASAGSAICW